MKVAIIGTSNIGALKYAAPRIEADSPGISLAFWGLPGGKFDECAVTAAGVLQPPEADSEMLRLARRINGARGIDLAGVDATLVMADALGMPACLWTALHYDVAEWPTRRGLPLISEAAYLSAMDEAITTRADHLRAQFGALPLFAALAPYPTTAVVPPGPHHQQPYAGIADHPEAARIEALFLGKLAAALADRDVTFVAQPRETVARPFLTHEPYGHGAMDFRTRGVLLDDHRHMNADFGASLFAAFALALGQTDAALQN